MAHPTEAEMRDSVAPTLKTVGELRDYIAHLLDRPHDYGTCVYAMSLAATAAFNHVATVLGVTGFQASCADLDILKRTRGLKHGFLILDADNLLYPQYDIPGKVADWVEKTRPTLADEARRLLKDSATASPDVIERWRELAALCPAKETE